MSQQTNNSLERPTPFLKRVINLEKAVAELKKEKVCGCVKKITNLENEISELKKQIEILKKVLKR
jgi:hypothetical protein